MILKNIQLTALFILSALTVLTLQSSWAVADTGIKKIGIEKNPYGIRIKLTGKASYKIVQFDKKEILVAFKDVVVEDTLKPLGSGLPLVKGVKIAKRKQGVVSLIISTGRDVSSVSSVWIPVGNTLLVKPAFFGVKKAKKNGKEPLSKKILPEGVATSPGRTAIKPDVAMMPGASRGNEFLPGSSKDVEAFGKTLDGRTFDERFSGTTDDLLLEFRSDACEDLGDVKKTVILCNQGAWGRAYDIASDYVDDNSLNVRCLENIYIIRAYSFFKDIKNGSPQDYLEAARYFQDLISYFPESIYVPYAIASLGKIHVQLKDMAQAEGYFQIILKVYKDYPGTPEILFELGKIYTEQKKTKLAIAMLRNVVEQFPNGKFIGQAKLELGKALFNINDFSAAIKVLTDVVNSSPRMVFETPELLQFLGNAYYHTGKSKMARKTLVKVYNLFPELEDRDTILTRIGDTFVENKEKEKAIKIFELVIEKYPGTDGFVISSMRLAEFIESREKKEELYNMIIKDFPDNPLARLAMMRLALLQHNSGEYEQSVATVKTLLATQPRALKKDAVNLLQDSSELIFKKLLAEDNYTELLGRFEEDKRMLDSAESPDIFLFVGMAYLRAHLHENAVDLLLKSYKRTGKSKRPADLIYSLGVAMDEAGRLDEAFTMLSNFVKYFPKKKEVADAYSRMGHIMLEKKKYKVGIRYLKTAYNKSTSNNLKAKILINESKGYKELGAYGEAVKTLIKAINILASEPEESFETLSLVHRNLGDNYMKMNSWEKAADAFTMAVKFAGKEADTTEIYFMLGEAYQNERKYDDARTAYQRVVDNGDSFWSSMAQERLRSMELKKTLEKT